MIERRHDHKVIVYKKKLYVFGGLGRDGPLNSVEMYSEKTNKFVKMAPMKNARYGFSCCRVGKLVYVFSGWIENNRTESVEVYDLDSNTWTDGVDFPGPGVTLHACVVNNKLN